MGSHRTFLPIKSYPAYNNALEHMIMNSNILNADPDDQHSVHNVVWNKENLTYSLIQRIGDEEGFAHPQWRNEN